MNIRERLEQEALAWIKTLVLQPAGFQLVNAEPQVANGQDHQSHKWDWVVDADARNRVDPCWSPVHSLMPAHVIENRRIGRQDGRTRLPGGPETCPIDTCEPDPM